MGLPFLGEVPTTWPSAWWGLGVPLVAGHPDSPQTKAFMEMGEDVG